MTDVFFTVENEDTEWFEKSWDELVERVQAALA